MACVRSPGVTTSPPSVDDQRIRLNQQQRIAAPPRSQRSRPSGAILCSNQSVRPRHSLGSSFRHVRVGRNERSRSWVPDAAPGHQYANPCRRQVKQQVSSALKGIETEWRTSMSYEQGVTLQVGTLPASRLKELGTCLGLFWYPFWGPSGHNGCR